MPVNALPRASKTAIAVTLSTFTALGLAGCGTPPEELAPTPSPGASSTPSATPTEDTVAAPTFAPAGGEFGLDQAAEFPDGLRIEVTSIKTATANEQQNGAEGTNGNMVVAEIGITNNTGSAYPTDPIQVWGFYDGVGAPKVRDTSGALGDRFSGTIGEGESAVATMGFAIPADRLNNVAIMVDTRNEAHGPVQFIGQVGQ